MKKRTPDHTTQVSPATSGCMCAAECCGAALCLGSPLRASASWTERSQFVSWRFSVARRPASARGGRERKRPRPGSVGRRSMAGWAWLHVPGSGVAPRKTRAPCENVLAFEGAGRCNNAAPRPDGHAIYASARAPMRVFQVVCAASSSAALATPAPLSRCVTTAARLTSMAPWATPGHGAMIRDASEELRCSLLRSFLFGWCTAARYGGPPRTCQFGCAEGQDEQSHYLACLHGEIVRVVLFADPLGELCMGRLLLGLERGGTWRRRTLLVFDLLLHAFDVCRHGSRATPRQLALSRLKELRRRHPANLELASRARSHRLVDVCTDAPVPGSVPPCACRRSLV